MIRSIVESLKKNKHFQRYTLTRRPHMRMSVGRMQSRARGDRVGASEEVEFAGRPTASEWE